MQVLKFGGTSMATAATMSEVVKIVAKALEKDRTILVCSAISKCTDTLIEIGQKASMGDPSYVDIIEALKSRHIEIIENLLFEDYAKSVKIICNSYFDSLSRIVQGVYMLGEISERSMSAIQSFGELLSTQIISAKFAEIGIANKWVDSRDVVKTVAENNNAVNEAETYANIESVVENSPSVSLFIFPGFIASDEHNRITTLGRGGSDFTASLLAAGTRARLLEIWTDVPGMMTSNPKIVPTARTIRNISYRAAQELSHFGAKVIYPPTLQPVISKSIPIYVKNTFTPEDPGTLVEKNPPHAGNKLVGISNADSIALISLEGSGMVGIPGFSSRLFDTLSRNDINIILITQASSVHTMCIAIAEKDAAKAKKASDDCFAYEISQGRLNPLKVETGYSIVCLVVNDVLGNSGATGRMLAALGRRGIPVRATAQGSSERNISVIVPSDRVNEATRQIHDEFFDRSELHVLNLFVAGYGTVGKAFVEMVRKNAAEIEKRTGKRLKICGISNSRKFVIDKNGLDLTKVPELLQNGKSSAEGAFPDAVMQLSLVNSIFLDCTATREDFLNYRELFNHGCSLVACNKIPFSGTYDHYKSIKDTANDNGVNLKFETTVGAALPVIETINRIINSGDVIQRVDAVLSGTLNYLFSNYQGSDFAGLVAIAKEKGYTEPDPMIDLSGKDVLRKLLIISREAGIPLEASDVTMEAVPEEEEILRRYKAAIAEGNKLRYVATLEKDPSAKLGYKADIGLKSVGPDVPLHHLNGTDNAVIIKTDFYPSPLVIQGAGAGANQTASGILNDIII